MNYISHDMEKHASYLMLPQQTLNKIQLMLIT